MFKSEEENFVREADKIIKDALARKGIIIRTMNIDDALIKIGKLYHQKEKEDEL